MVEQFWNENSLLSYECTKLKIILQRNKREKGTSFLRKAITCTEILQFLAIILDIIISNTINYDFNLILHDFQSISQYR